MKFLILFIHILLLAWISQKLRRSDKSPVSTFFLPALSVKLICGIMIGLIYSFYYSAGDTFPYYYDSATLASLAKTDFKSYLNFLWTTNEDFTQVYNLNFQDPRALFMVKVTSLFNLISYNNYWLISIYFSFISFLGAWYLVKRITDYFQEYTSAAAIAFLFFPSVIFWTSGLIKESLAMASLFFLTGIFLKVWFSGKVKIAEWIIAILSGWILWKLKYYFAAVFLTVTFTSLVYKFVTNRFLTPKKYLLEIFLWSIIFLLPLSIVTILHPNFYPERFFNVIVENYYAYSKLSSPDNLIHFRHLSSNGWDILRNAPIALFSGLLRPFIWESNNAFQILASIENLVILLLFAYGLYHIKLIFQSPYRMLIFSLIVYVCSLCIFITLSTPNFGTLSRYRVGYLPFFIFLLLCNQKLLGIFERTLNRLVQYKR